MNILQLTPGAGAMFCGNCFRDNALVGQLRKLGHQVLMVPLYLPLTLDEQDQSAGTPIFFSGINVYLQQKSALFRQAPDWFRNLLSSASLLKWAAGQAARTRPQELGEVTLSMLRGEEGNQARELEGLLAWLKAQPRPDVVCLSNALLLGMARRLKAELRAPLVCTLQGEDSFLEALPEAYRAQCWQTLAQRAAEVDLFIAPSRYFGELMRKRLNLPASRVRVVYNGINLDGYAEGTEHLTSNAQHPTSNRKTDEPECASHAPRTTHHAPRLTHHASRITPAPAPTLGYFARMCREKGLDTLVEAYILLRRRAPGLRLKLRIGGSCGPADQALVRALRGQLRAVGLLEEEVEFCPNLDRAGKLAFLKSLSLFSVPAAYGEAFGLYVIEALAAGVPVVQPRTAAFPELVEATGGGVLCEPGNPAALAEAIGKLLAHPERLRQLGEAGRTAVSEQFSAEAMARQVAAVCQELTVRP